MLMLHCAPRHECSLVTCLLYSRHSSRITSTDASSSVLARTGSTGKLPVGAARRWLKVGKQPILPVILGTSRYCVPIPKSCYYNVMANET